MTKINTEKRWTEAHRGNMSFDEDFHTYVYEGLGYDGQNLTRNEASDLQLKVVESGGYTYICKSAVGTAEATAKWKIYRLDSV